MWELEIVEGMKPVGYRFLVEKFNIQTMPHYRWSYIGLKWESRQINYDDIHLELHFFSKSYQIKDCPFTHLEFAIKYEGLNLLIIKNVFLKLNPTEITTYIIENPTSKYARKLWFLYEFLFNAKLSIADLERASYVPLLDPKTYYTGAVLKSPRHRILNNLLGSVDFSPLVRRSKKLFIFEEKKLQASVEKLTQKFDVRFLERAMRYLYTKETMASWEIEREKPDKARLVKFVSLLEQGKEAVELSKQLFIDVQKEIVDARFVLNDYRSFQNYVGEEPLPGEVSVHFISPKPEDLAGLMQGMIACSNRILTSDIPASIVAAVVSFGFVFMHPFWDGNGRLHRFLIHYVLSKLKFAPNGLIFPVSAAMLRDPKAYDLALESFSKPLSKLITDYEFNEIGEMHVKQDTCDYYKFLDCTYIAEYLCECIERTITIDFEAELNFLSQYDQVKAGIKQIIDMPDQRIDLFIKCVRQNGGRLSERKKVVYFSMLTNDEIEQMQSLLKGF